MVGIVDDLKRIPMSAALAQTLSRAAEYAQGQSHDQVQLEHLLLALTEDTDAIGVLSASHVDTALLKADVSLYLGGLTDRITISTGLLAIAPDLKRILEAAAAAASQGRRRDINGAIVLAAIVGDARSPAAHMLRAQGLTFEEAIKALQRAMTQAAPAARAAPPAAEDLLATARARINTRLPPQPAPVPPDPVMPPAAAAAPIAAVMPPTSSFNTAPEEALSQRAPDWPPHVRPGTYDAAEPHGVAPLVDADAGVQWRTALPQPGGEFPAQPQDDVPVLADSAQSGYEREHEAGFFQPEIPGTAALAREFPSQPARPQAPPQGSRWPAPVAPAWRETTQAPASYAPPPLPPQSPADFEGAWPPEPGALQFEEDAAVTGPQPPSWPEPNPYGHSASEDPGSLQPAFDSWQAGSGPPPMPPLVPLSVPAADPDAVPTTRGRRRKSPDATARGLGEAIPRRMRAHVPAIIDAQLPKADIAAIVAGLAGAVDSGAMQAPAMSVRLRSSDGTFLIDASSPETQWFDHRPDIIQSEFANWRWTVTPLKPGRRQLQLAVAVRALGPDGIAADHILPDCMVDVRVGRNYGRAMLGLLKWAFVATAGGLAAMYGGSLLNPVIGAVLKLIK